jgi:HEAT repeat protein
VREEIAKRLGKFAGKEAVKPLVFSEAFDKAHNVRIYAGWALRDIPAKEKEGVLLGLSRSKDEVLRAEALLEIGRLGNVRLLKILKKALKKDKSEYVKAYAAQGLSFIPAKEVKNLLREALADSQKVAHAAADSLLHCAGSEDLELALGMVKGEFSKDPYIKRVGEKIIEKISD